MSYDELIARAKQAAGAPARNEDWGERIESLNETGDVFTGVWNGEVADDAFEGHSRRVYLLWDDSGAAVWVRGKWSLNNEVDRVRPEPGDRVAIYVGDSWEGKGGISGFYFGLEKEPCTDPLPGQPVGGGGDSDIPFEPVP